MGARPTISANDDLVLLLLVVAVGVPFVCRLTVAGVVLVVVDHVSLWVLRLLLEAFLHHRHLLAEFSTDVLMLCLSWPSRVVAARLFLYSLAVLLLLLRDHRSVKWSTLAVMLRTSGLVKASSEEFDLLPLKCLA